MAGLKITQQSDEIDCGTSKKTVLQLSAPAQQRVVIKEISISFNGSSLSDPPVLVTVEVQAAGGTFAGAKNPVKVNPGDPENVNSTGSQNCTSTAQPAVTAEIIGEEVSASGGYAWVARFGEEIELQGGKKLGITVLAQVGGLKCKARFKGEE